MTDMELMHEAHTRYDTMQMTVELLNLYSQFVRADEDSDLEKAIEETLDRILADEIKKGNHGLIGHVALALCAIVDDTADPEKVQNFLDLQNTAIQNMIEEANGPDNA